MDDRIGSLMLEQLKLLRGDIGDLRGEVSRTNEGLDQLRSETNERLDHLRQDTTRGFLETNTKLTELTGEVRELKDRFEHFVRFAGEEVRALRETVTNHERRLARLEGPEAPGVVRDRGADYTPRSEE